MEELVSDIMNSLHVAVSGHVIVLSYEKLCTRCTYVLSLMVEIMASFSVFLKGLGSHVHTHYHEEHLKISFSVISKLPWCGKSIFEYSLKTPKSANSSHFLLFEWPQLRLEAPI